MDAQELRNLQEAYTEVYNELDEELTGARRMKALDIMRKEKFKGKKARQVADIVSGKEGSKSPSGEGINLPTKRGGGGEKKEPKTGRGGDWYADRGVKKEQVDIYDIILSHLLDEGYASTAEAAEAIMVNMSEEWRQSILG